MVHEKGSELTQDDTKYVGGKVPVELFWRFKKAAAERKESTQEAILNAIELYIDVKTE